MPDQEGRGWGRGDLTPRAGPVRVPVTSPTALLPPPSPASGPWLCCSAPGREGHLGTLFTRGGSGKAKLCPLHPSPVTWGKPACPFRSTSRPGPRKLCPAVGWLSARPGGLAQNPLTLQRPGPGVSGPHGGRCDRLLLSNGLLFSFAFVLHKHSFLMCSQLQKFCFRSAFGINLHLQKREGQLQRVGFFLILT